MAPGPRIPSRVPTARLLRVPARRRWASGAGAGRTYLPVGLAFAPRTTVRRKDITVPPVTTPSA